MDSFQRDYQNRWILLNRKIIDGISEEQVIEISELESEKLNRAQNNIFEYQILYRKYLTVRNNLADYDRIVELYKEKLKKTKITNSMEVQKEAYIEVNRVFTNFVASFKSFIEDSLVNHLLPKIYGKGSKQIKTFKLKTNNWYDCNFSYRFLMRVRDFAIHHDLPIYEIRVGLTPDEKSSYPKSVRIIPMFVKSYLLKNKTIKSKLGEDLEKYNNAFPVKPILTSITVILDEIMATLVKISNGKYLSSANDVLEYENRFKEPFEVWFGFVEAHTDFRLVKLESENAKKIKKKY